MSHPRHRINIPEVKPFRLAKYFAITSFIVIIIISIPFALFISQKAKDILIKNYKDYAFEVGTNIDLQLLQNFTLPMMEQYGNITLSSDPQREALDSAVRKATESLNVDVINLHSLYDGLIIYSTDESLIKEKTIKTDGYLKATKGELSSELTPEGDIFWGLGLESLGGQKKVTTYIPLKFPLRDEVIIIGILEMVLDMTEQYNSIAKFQYTIFGMSILIMIIIFFALLFIVRKAERIIESRTIEQRKLVEQLNLAERLAALGEMVAGVSHEIKNPLGIIQSTAELLNNMPEAGEKHKRLSSVITEESIRLNRIVTEFLDFSRPHELNLQKFFLSDIIQKNIDFLKPEIDKKGISVNTNIDGQKYPITADQDLLHRVLMNLIINAMQAMPDEGSINIDITEGKGEYIIEIKDSGCGISSENLNKIFNPFFTTKEKGSGLGLPIVRKIVEGHGGTIEIESREGEGTGVTLNLPKK
jgi:two-component system sensor histidine kinase HydH